MKTRTISVEALGRIEGEAGLTLRLREGAVADVRLNVFEPPRFFEALLRGRGYAEVPDIVARICGICPVAHQITACRAIEHAFGVTIDPAVRLLRRLLYLGEWIESHALHVYLLHTPDFLALPDAIAVSRDHPELVARGLRIKKVGNALLTVIGGREIHPVNLRVGGLYCAPAAAALHALVRELEWARDASIETVRFVSTLEFPDFEPPAELVAVQNPGEYAIDEGRIASSAGLSIDAREYEHQFTEIHIAHSHALHSVGPDQVPYSVGPLARYTLNRAWLSPAAADAARAAGITDGCHNPFKSIIVRAVELVHACDDALALIREYEPPGAPAATVDPAAGSGSAVTEAPRGLLFHRYRLDGKGRVTDANIVPPTAQNQAVMERDLRQLVSTHSDMSTAALTALCEHAIRNYDPCISCATHFLRLRCDDPEP
jgi:coenzyme F420-reducing hydrogenase alpha subunit